MDIDDVKRMLSKRKDGDPTERMEYRTPPGKSTIRREVKTRDGETIYVENREITVNPYTAQQEHVIIEISQRCESCGMPITGEMLALDLIRPCISCQKKTCPRCRVNTNVHEYLRPEVRGQPICEPCWNRFTQQLIVLCPNCRQPVKDYYDIKRCRCNVKVCPACGVSVPGGGLLCRRCHAAREDGREAAEVADTIFREVLGRTC